MAVMCPTLFKPTGIPNLVRYLKEIAQHAPSTPFLYYDINVLTNVVCKYYSMLTISTLAGLVFSQNQ